MMSDTPRMPVEEIVVQRNGQARQAGTTAAEGSTVRAFRARAEEDLFVFAFGVLDQHWLYPPLHRPICQWLQRCPPYRKALVVPRGHGKSTLGCQALPLHLLVQPAETNCYFPGLPGTDTRILLCGEKTERAQDHLRVMEDHLVANALLRALWPHVVWDNAKRQSKKWNDTEMIVPRAREWPDPTVRAIGVGGAITGAHPNVLLKDDITTEAAANSPVVMQMAIRWHENIRALLVHLTDLEFLFGTRWTAGDLIAHIEQEDSTVEVNTDWRRVTTAEGVLYPQTSRGDPKFGAPGAVAQLQAQHGPMFWLLYMNSVGDSQLTDFDVADLRSFEMRSGMLCFGEDDRDATLATAVGAPGHGTELNNGGRGMTLTDYFAAVDQARGGGGLSAHRVEYLKATRSGGRTPAHENIRGPAYKGNGR